ncbi:MAG TPA: PfkB family carbohydrate kinase [Candidatus Lokiarchaeia archaeon]|nr:PfkB family carbohydrate kinase [Candidatus Lokiarchaeia archaeon]
MGKIIVVGELHQDLYYKTTFFSDLSESLSSTLWAFLEANPQPDYAALQTAINTVIAETPKKIPGESFAVRGGNGNNSAELLAKFGLPVQLLTVVGRGVEWMRPQLEDLGIDPTTVFEKDAPTPISTIVEDPKFTKIFVAPNLKAEMNFDGVELPSNLFEDADLFFATPMDFKYADLLRQAVESGSGTIAAFTLETQKIPDLPALDACVTVTADLMFANLDDCALIAGAPIQSDGEWESVEQIDNQFAKYATTRVYTWGKRGAYICSRNQIRAHVPSYEVTVVNRTGAGDTFAAGFVAKLDELLLQRQDPRDLPPEDLELFWKQCAEYGAAAAAFRISHDYAPAKKELEKYFGELGPLFD